MPFTSIFSRKIRGLGEILRAPEAAMMEVTNPHHATGTPQLSFNSHAQIPHRLSK
jgi:hypothetical protein